MLELEPPRHTHLRKMVLHAFTSRRIAALGPEIENLCHRLIDNFPNDPFDILSTYATQVPVIVIARLLGVPESMTSQLLRWSNDMVMMYQARRTPELEDQAVISAIEFSSFMATYIEERRRFGDLLGENDTASKSLVGCNSFFYPFLNLVLRLGTSLFSIFQNNISSRQLTACLIQNRNNGGILNVLICQ